MRIVPPGAGVPNFKQPRIPNKKHLAFVAKLPCVACLCSGIRRTGVHVAHLRAASAEYGKPITGMGQKPSDCWVLPLCPHHHLDDQHRGDELEFWQRLGIDPFRLALDLYEIVDDVEAAVVLLLAARS